MKWFIFHEGELFITNENGTHAVPCGMLPPIEIPEGANVHAIGEIDGIPCKTFQASQQPPCHENGQWTGLRESYDYINLKQYKMAGKAAQILYWDRNSRFHIALMDSYGNAFLSDMLKRSMILMKRAYAQYQYNKWQRLTFKGTATGHRELIATIRSGNKAEAVEKLRRDVASFDTSFLS